ncbi:MAG: DUF305 domain-containing protein [Alphaproteobacteria bacterium]|uniref:DUF305 domain-containing protein n=1 Tax=Candidatus Nitrobium versatile TaxID=2884831 RepID=A0A953J5T4_9BACT|nr:DUF305 domain-containing protein [Candidatus Nitrobium versatile]
MLKVFLTVFLLVSITALLTAADIPRPHGKGDRAAHDTFTPGTDRPFDTLMYDAVRIMHRDMGAVKKYGDPDLDFVSLMIPHHQGAVDMARVVLLYGKDRELGNLAQRIIASQVTEIRIMKEWKARQTLARQAVSGEAFYPLLEKAHAAMHRNMENAPRTGDPDHDFAVLMIPHHQGAVDMAKALLLHGKDPEMRTLAQQMITEQQYEIDLMQSWLKTHQLPETK